MLLGSVVIIVEWRTNPFDNLKNKARRCGMKAMQSCRERLVFDPPPSWTKTQLTNRIWVWLSFKEFEHSVRFRLA